MLKNVGSMVLAAMIGSGTTFAGVAWTTPAREATNQVSPPSHMQQILEPPSVTLLRHYDLDREANANREDAILQQLRALNETATKLQSDMASAHGDAVAANSIQVQQIGQIIRSIGGPGAKSVAAGFRVDRP